MDVQETIHMENLKRLGALWRLLTTHTHLSEFVTPRDRKVFSRRAQGEGMSFLTVTLPRLYKALDSALESGQLEPIEGFVTKEGCVYPLFLHLAWGQIFNEDGSLKPYSVEHADAVACIRQLSAVYYKLELPYTSDQEQAVFAAFKANDSGLAGRDLSPVKGVLERARKLVCRLLAGVSPQSIVPRHGSGSSACGIVPHERYESFRFIPRLNAEFPYDEYFYFSPSHLVDELDKLVNAETAEPTAKVVLVPKDSRGPRLISEEPREFMYIQQGLMALLYDVVESHPAIARQIGFTDQTRNQLLARHGSMSRDYATLDLKDASDLVSWELVKELFPGNWVAALAASRSLATVLPNGEVVQFRKFAPMGSALCFPVEAICFWSIALAACGMDDTYINRLFRNAITSADMQISVFGDDIIVQSEYFSAVVDTLEQCGLKVNTSKSYVTGFFRESCGGDFYHGHNVTPVRVKCLPSDDARSRHRTCQVFNNLIDRYGYSRVGLALQLLFEDWYGPVPVTNRVDRRSGAAATSGLALIGPVTDVPRIYRRRFNPALQRIEYRVPKIVVKSIDLTTERWSSVLRKFNMNLRETSARGALPKRSRIKYGWTEL
jgi:hypothetical protein